MNLRVRSALGSLIPLVLSLAVLVPGSGHLSVAPAVADAVGEKVLLDNERVTMIEFVFPPKFEGEEHAAVADEFAYVLEGEFAVVTKGKGKRVLRPGEVEYAAKYTVHHSLNETAKPARVLVVLLKDR
jgi:quercetin dioxygenase-like cupin family protein